MGFFNSLKGQVRRDTGRVISNTIFGNRHASKHQRVEAQNTKANLKGQKDYELEILEQEQQNNDAEFKRLQLRENNLRFEKEIANIVSVKVPQKKEDLMEALNELSMMISANPWKNILEADNKVSNNYSDVVLKKYEQCLFSLKTKFPKEGEIIYYESQFKKFKNESIKGKFLIIFLATIVIIIIGVLAVNGVFDDKAEVEQRQNALSRSIKSIFN
jgi:hypothetical protein